ncbi:MAG: cytochrome P450 [Pseudomonadota bacterium]
MALDSQIRQNPAGVHAPDQPLGFWGTYRAARRNVLELIPAAAYREPAIVDKRRGRWIMLMDPPSIDRVLRTQVDNYPKSAILLRLMTPREGTNLIVTEGEIWQRQRRALSAPFRPRTLQVAGPIIEEAAAEASAMLARTTEPQDVFPLMAAASCDVMVDLALGGRDAIDRAALNDAVDRYVAGLGRVSLFDVLGVPNWIPRPAALFDGSRKRMDDIADAVIDARQKRGPSPRPDLLDLLIEAHAEGTLNALEVRNNLLGFLFAGHETTALSLTWALYLLALHPTAQDHLRSEIETVCGQQKPTIEDASRLTFARQVLDETLRLYPPAGFLTRTARLDDTLAGHKVRAGATVILPVYALHRHALHWDAPERFMPERFDPEKPRQYHRSAYLPFGDGPRICIGASMALLEATLLLATLVQSLRFSLPEGYAPTPQMWFTLRPKDGMTLTATPVSGSGAT